MSVNNIDNNNEATVVQVPYPSKKYLRTLRKRCSDWIQEFGETLSELNASDIGQSRFEKACRQSNGKPFVFDDGNMRSLHFDRRTMQSAMWVEAPNELAFGYTRCMMGFLLANNEPKHILMIGLGGGSLVKFCHKYLPETLITVVEIDSDVIALRDQFLIPPDDDRLQIIHMDAMKFVAICEHEYDVILLDGFDADGLVTGLLTDEFYLACKDVLNQNGILVTNMWGESKDLISVISRMSMAFENSVWWCRSIDSYNLVAFAFKSGANEFNKNLKEQAKLLDQYYRLEFEKLVTRLQTISKDSVNWMLAENPDHHHLGKFLVQEEIAGKIEYLLNVDEMIARTRLEWMNAHQHPLSHDSESIDG